MFTLVFSPNTEGINEELDQLSNFVANYINCNRRDIIYQTEKRDLRGENRF